MPHMNMEHSEDPKQIILDALGDISDYKVFHNEVIVAVYLRPEKTKSGIILPDGHRDEDRHQSNGVLCRALQDNRVKGSIPHPDMVW